MIINGNIRLNDKKVLTKNINNDNFDILKHHNGNIYLLDHKIIFWFKCHNRLFTCIHGLNTILQLFVVNL